MCEKHEIENIEGETMAENWRSLQEQGSCAIFLCDLSDVLLLNNIDVISGGRERKRERERERERRSEERRVGKECRCLCRSRWSPYH